MNAHREVATPLGLGLGAASIMSRPVRAIRATAPVREAAQSMTEHKVSSLVVLDARGWGIGIVSASDIVAYEVTRRDRVLDEDRYGSLKARARKGKGPGFRFAWTHDLSVREVMTPTLITAPLHTTIGHVAWLMSRKRIHRVFLQDQGRIKGVVTSLDVARAVGRDFGTPEP